MLDHSATTNVLRPRSRLTPFLVMSVLAHLVLMLLIGLPTRRLQDKQQELEAAEQKIAEERRQEKVKAAEEAEEAIRMQAREELAVEQFRSFLDELVGDALPPEEVAALWGQIENDIAPDLDQLLGLIDNPPDSALMERLLALAHLAGSEVLVIPQFLRPQEKVQLIKEKILEQVVERIGGERARVVEKAILDQARAAAQQIAEHLKKELQEKIGAPAGEKINAVREKEATARLLRLEAVEAALGALHPQIKAAADHAREVQKPIQQAGADLEKAKDKKDAAATSKAASALRAQATALTKIATEAAKAIAPVPAAREKIATDAPAIAQKIDQLANRINAAKETAKEGAAEATGREAAKAEAQAKKAEKELKDAVQEIEQVRAALQLQIARENAAKLADAVAAQARNAAKLADNKAKDAPAKVIAAAKDAAIGKQQADAIAKQIDKAKDKADVAAAKAKIADAAAELQKAQDVLAKPDAKQAAEPLAKAADQLAKLDADLKEAQKKLGVDHEAVRQALAKQQLEMLLKDGQLADPAKAQFERQFQAQLQAELLKKFDAAAQKRLQAERVNDPKRLQEMRRELEKIVGKELLEQVGAEKAVGRGIEAKLPPVQAVNPPKLEVQPDPKLAGEAKQIVNQQAAQALPAILAGAMRDPGLNQVGQRPADLKAPPAVLQRLEIFQNQLAQGRREFLGQPNATAIAAARIRSADRSQTLQRLGQYGDVDAAAYRKMVALMKERGRVTGEALKLQGAQGETAVAEADTELRPALMVTPTPQTEAEKKVERKLPEPSFKSNRFTAIPFLEMDAITIDGNLDDWKGIPTLSLEPVLKGKNPGTIKADLQTAQVAYTSQGILIAVDVIDNTGKIENDRPMDAFWMNDGLEIFIDTLNTKYSRRGEVSTHQFFAFPFGHKTDMVSSGYESRATGNATTDEWKRVAHGPDVIQRKAVKTERGWAMEMMVPKSLLRKGEVRPGRIIGFNLQLDTGCDLYYYWTCNKKIISSQHPDTWGDIQLLGSDAKVELFDIAGKEKLTAISPGKAVKVRVSDPDMNLDDVRKDKIAATLRTAGGDRETVILEETAVGSGVFEGTVSVQLNIGGTGKPNVLEVFEGEPVTIEYIDQARAFGERDVPVKMVVPVGSLGRKLEK